MRTLVVLLGACVIAKAAVPASAPAKAHGRIAETLVRNFAILRQPVRRSERLPIAEQRQFTYEGLLPAQARRALIPSAHIQAWLIPGPEGYCWIAGPIGGDPGGDGGTCSGLPLLTAPGEVPAAKPLDTLGKILLVGALLGSGAPGPAIGLVTDRVRALRLVGPTGERRAIRIHEGFYATAYQDSDRLVAITTARRHTTVETFP